MKKFDIAGSAIYAGLAKLGMGSVTILMVVILLNIIFGARVLAPKPSCVT